MQDNPTLGETLDLVRALHVGQTDLAGRPYWYHPVSVMLLLPDSATEEERHAALLHDVLEDTSMTGEALKVLHGYSDRIVALVEGVTRKPDGRTYRQWIDDIALSGDAGIIRIKLADMRHNSSPERHEGIADPEKLLKVREMAERRWIPGIHRLTDALLKLSA